MPRDRNSMEKSLLRNAIFSLDAALFGLSNKQSACELISLTPESCISNVSGHVIWGFPLSYLFIFFHCFPLGHSCSHVYFGLCCANCRVDMMCAITVVKIYKNKGTKSVVFGYFYWSVHSSTFIHVSISSIVSPTTISFMKMKGRVLDIMYFPLCLS